MKEAEYVDRIDFKDPEWLAEQLGIDKNTVYKHLQDGKIPGLQLGRKWLVSEAQVAEWLRNETARQTRARQEAVTSAEHVVRQMSNYSAGMREVLRHAHAEARRYGHRQLGQEHMVLAMTSSASCNAAGVMTALGITEDRIRESFERLCPPGEGVSPRRLGRSADAKKATKLAAEEADSGGSKLVSTGHLLLGILRSGDGKGLAILRDVGLSVDAVRSKMGQLGDRDER